MSEYRKLGAARLLRDNSYAGKEGATLEVVEYPNEGWFGPALEDGSDNHGDFWAYPSAVTTVEHTLPIVCIGKPGRDFEWASQRDADKPAKEPRSFLDMLDPTHPMASARIVRRQVWSWPALQSLFLRTTDGGVLCSKCVEAEWSNVSWAHRNRQDNGWRPMNLGHGELEEGPVHCDHCGYEVAP